MLSAETRDIFRVEVSGGGPSIKKTKLLFHSEKNDIRPSPFSDTKRLFFFRDVCVQILLRMHKWLTEHYNETIKD